MKPDRRGSSDLETKRYYKHMVATYQVHQPPNLDIIGYHDLQNYHHVVVNETQG